MIRTARAESSADDFMATRFHKLDLNLLVALEALLQERNVSAAADRLNLSQSAMSSALARLRDYFDDDLLTMKGRRLVATAKGERLLEPVQAVLEQIHRTIVLPKTFDAATSKRRMVIMATDATFEVLLRPALREVERLAPFMTFEIVPISQEAVPELNRGHCDLLLSVDTSFRQHLSGKCLVHDEHVAVAWKDNEELEGDTIALDAYETLGHVVVRPPIQTSLSALELELERRSINRRTELLTPSFASAAGILVGSRRIATMDRRFAQHMARFLPLRLLALPFDTPRIEYCAYWPLRGDGDEAVQWLVNQLEAAVVDRRHPAGDAQVEILGDGSDE